MNIREIGIPRVDPVQDLTELSERLFSSKEYGVAKENILQIIISNPEYAGVLKEDLVNCVNCSLTKSIDDLTRIQKHVEDTVVETSRNNIEFIDYLRSTL